MRHFPFATCAMLLALLSSCEWSWDEVARAPSPSGRVDAVLVERNGGATTSFGYEVFLVPGGGSAPSDSKQAVAWLYGAVRSDSAYGVNLRWITPDSLGLEYLEAREAKLLQPIVTVRGDRVHIRFRSGIEDRSAPAGGMEYNLRK
jgi:hypothetical protein